MNKLSRLFLVATKALAEICQEGDEENFCGDVVGGAAEVMRRMEWKCGRHIGHILESCGATPKSASSLDMSSLWTKEVREAVENIGESLKGDAMVHWEEMKERWMQTADKIIAACQKAEVTDPEDMAVVAWILPTALGMQAAEGENIMPLTQALHNAMWAAYELLVEGNPFRLPIGEA